MNDIGIIADDLTGASDSGVQLARRGLTTSVVFDIDTLAEESSSLDAIVIDTDSRAIAAEEAYNRVRRAADKLRILGITRVFKKIDSTLRGNIGSEIDSLMDAHRFDFSVVAPAFPGIGRTTLGGRHFLQGKPIDQTEIASDPKCPVRESDLIKLLSSQSKRKVGAVHLSTLEQGQQAVFAQLEALKNQGIDLVVFDADQDEHLHAIVKYLSDSTYELLWVGSAGLAEHIPLLLDRNVSVQRSTAPPGSAGKSVMLIAGSLSQTTRKQIEFYNTIPSVAAVDFDPASVMHEQSRAEQQSRCLRLIQEAIDHQQNISFYVRASSELLNANAADRIAAFLGEVSSAIIRTNELQGLIMTGGDTAKAVCANLGVPGLVLVDEVEKGVPLSRLMGERPLYVVTKAGAFGTEETLAHALHVLKGDQP